MGVINARLVDRDHFRGVLMNKYIAVAGNIGAGKSTLVRYLAKTYGIEPYFEPNDENPYLSDFYDDMPKWAFHSQTYFLTHKYKIHREIEEKMDPRRSLAQIPIRAEDDRSADFQGDRLMVIDRTIYEDAEIFGLNLFESGKMTQPDFQTYWSLYEALKENLRAPDLMIYLRCPVEQLQKRITERGRAMEAQIPLEYLENLQRLYDTWISRFDACKVVTLETDGMTYSQDIFDKMDVIKSAAKLAV